MHKVFPKSYTHCWCFLMSGLVIFIASVYFFNFKFRTRLSPMINIRWPSDNSITYPMDTDIHQPFNMTRQIFIANLLNTTVQPSFSDNYTDLVNKTTGANTKGPFFMKIQNLFSLVLNVTTQKPVDTRYFVCYVPQGRLGNQLFQYASVYGIATLNNLSIMTPESCEICNYFIVKNVTVSRDQNGCSKFMLLSETMPRVFFPELLSLPKNVNIFLRGYFQSWKYFQNVTASLLGQLRFREPIETISRRELENLKLKYISDNGSNLTVIGIHIRIGDLFSYTKNHEIGLVPAPPAYIKKAIQFYMAKYKAILFIVCSDTIQQAKAIIDSLNLSVNISYMEGRRKSIDDLAILSKCDHVIQTVGTFGWWAAYLAGGTSVYYKFNGRPGSSSEKRLNSYDFFYPEWIGLDEDYK